MNLKELVYKRSLSKDNTENKEENKNQRNVFLFEKIFQKGLGLTGIILIIILFSIFITLLISSTPSIKHLGIKFLYGKEWNPVTDEYGALPFLIGTLLTSLLALIISTPFALSTAIKLKVSR